MVVAKTCGPDLVLPQQTMAKHPNPQRQRGMHQATANANFRTATRMGYSFNTMSMHITAAKINIRIELSGGT